jgi:hypothetical protein
MSLVYFFIERGTNRRVQLEYKCSLVNSAREPQNMHLVGGQRFGCLVALVTKWCGLNRDRRMSTYRPM